MSDEVCVDCHDPGYQRVAGCLMFMFGICFSIEEEKRVEDNNGDYEKCEAQAVDWHRLVVY